MGVGINVVAPDAGAPEVPGKNRVAYVSEIAPALRALDTQTALDVVFEAELSAFQTLYQRWVQEGFAPFVSLFDQHAALQNRQVIVEDRVGNILGQGCVVGIDDGGCLVLSAADGAQLHIASGEAHIALSDV